jgi:RimJ/RimL family protein N-acetyltransferase
VDRFSTARLTAERLDPAHLDDLILLHLDPEVSRFLGGVRTADNTAGYLQTNLRHWDGHGFGLWVLRTGDGAFAGRAGLRYLQLDGVRELEIAYTFIRPLWGQGLATEVAHALVQIWRTTLADPSLMAIVDKGHQTSNAVLLKTGFDYERDTLVHGVPVGVFRQYRAA